MTTYRWQELGYESYNDYLRSRDWHEARQGMLDRFGTSCEHCGSDDRIEVHHFTYANLGDERVSDLAVLCWSCHKDIHQFADYGARIHRHVIARRRAYAERPERDETDVCLEDFEWE